MHEAQAVTRGRALVRNALALPLWPFVAGYLLLSDVLWPAMRPVVQAFARLRLARRLQVWLGTLAPYPALVILAVPAAVIELLKLVAVYWITTGHVITGTAALFGLHGASLLSTERLFAVLKPRLLSIGWFAMLWRRIEAIRDVLVRWVRATHAWARLRIVLGRARAGARRLSDRVRTGSRRRISPLD